MPPRARLSHRAGPCGDSFARTVSRSPCSASSSFSSSAQSLTGLRVYNDDAAEHGERPIGYAAYLGSGHFVESVFENWESEFLQMAAFVVLTIALKQKGSSESKPLEEKTERSQKPKARRTRPGRSAGAAGC